MKCTYIYILLDPITGKCRYVGKSSNPKFRFRRHIQESKKEKTHKSNWIKSLLSKGLKPVLKIVEEHKLSSWQKREQWWIRFFKRKHQPLTNGTKGGDGFGPGEENPMFGKTVYKVWLQKYGKQEADRLQKQRCERSSKSLKGKNTWSKNRKVLPEIIAKISAINKKHNDKRRQKTWIHKSCKQCSVDMFVSPNRRKIFCSKKCFRDSKEDWVHINCKQCNTDIFKSLVKHKPFCSRVCYWKWMKGQPSIKRRETSVICVNCQKQFIIFASQKGKKFCSKECYYKTKEGKPIPHIDNRKIK